jgi:hypothetical protein
VTPLQTLRLLRDIPGVAGSCLLDPESRVLVRDLPDDIDDALVTLVGRRAEAVLRAVGQPLPGATGAVLRFSRLAVFCGRAGSNVVLLLAAPRASTTAVKAAMKVAAPDLAHVSEPEPVHDTVTDDLPAPVRPRRRGDGIWG